MNPFDSGIVRLCALALAIAAFVVLYEIWLRLLGVIIIPDNAIGSLPTCSWRSGKGSPAHNPEL